MYGHARRSGCPTAPKLMPSVAGLSVGSTLLSAKKLAGKPPLEVEAVTVRESVADWVMVPEVPEIVMVDVPGVAVRLVVRVSVLWLDVLFGLRDAVTPEGTPEAERATGFEKFVSVTVTRAVPVAPC